MNGLPSKYHGLFQRTIVFNIKFIYHSNHLIPSLYHGTAAVLFCKKMSKNTMVIYGFN